MGEDETVKDEKNADETNRREGQLAPSEYDLNQIIKQEKHTLLVLNELSH